MKLKLTLLAAAVACGLLTGCAGSKVSISPAVVQQGVASSVRYGVGKYPDAIPAVKAGLELVCSAANQTNISPQVVIDGIEASANWDALKTPEAIFIMDGVVAFYTIAWKSYGDDAVNNRPALKGYLQAVCTGGHQGLPSGLMRASDTDHWPHLK